MLAGEERTMRRTRRDRTAATAVAAEPALLGNFGFPAPSPDPERARRRRLRARHPAELLAACRRPARLLLLLLLGLLPDLRIAAGPPDRSGPGDTRPDPDRKLFHEPLTLAQRQRVPRDRSRQRLLSRAIELRDEGHLDEAASAIETLLLQPDDCFVPRALDATVDSSRPDSSDDDRSAGDRPADNRPLPAAIGLRETIRRLLAESPELLAAFRERRQHATPSLACFDVPAVQIELDRAAASLAAGRVHAAHGICQRLLQTPGLPKSTRSQLAQLRIAAANHLDRPVTRTASRATGIYPVSFARPAKAPAPVLAWPRWRTDLRRDVMRDASVEWEADRREAQASLAGPQSCVVVAGAVVTATPHRLAAFDLATGSPRWTIQRTTPENDATVDSSRAFVAESILDGVHTRVTSLGTTVYVVDRREDRDVLRAFEVATDTPKLLWEAVLNGQSHGPPLAVAEGLFTLTTIDTALTLHRFTHEGELAYSQPLAIDQRDQRPTPSRAGSGIVPSLAAGLVICPTRLGVTVAVEPSTGALRWIDFDPSCLPSQRDRPLPAVSRSKGEPAYPSPLLVADDRLITLPGESNGLHCLDAATGRVHWRTTRQSERCLIGTCDDRVYASGDRSVAAFDLRTGDRLWTRRIATPSGRGVCRGDLLLLPMADGSLLRVDQATGAIRSIAHEVAACPCDELACDQSERRVGNLLAIPDGYVSISPTHLARFDTADVHADLLARNRTGLSRDQRLTRARIELVAGEVEAAVATLATPPATDPEWTHLKRESLFARLQDASAVDDGVLSPLSELSTSPTATARLNQQRLRLSLAENDLKSAADYAIALAASDALLTRDGVSQSGIVAARELISRSGRSFDAIAEIARDAEPTQRTALLQTFGSHPKMTSIWQDEARTARRNGQLQRAELALLQALAIAPPMQRDAVRRDLASLLIEAGRVREAAAMIGRDLVLSADVELSGELRSERARLQPAQRPVTSAEIELVRTTSTEWTDWYSVDRHKIDLPVARGISVLDADDDGEAILSIVSRRSPERLGEVRVPLHYWHPPESRHQTVGGVLALGCSSPVAVSLLEGRTLWESTGVFTSGRRPKILHAGPSVTVYQDRENLIALCTTDGSLAWKRSDLDRRSGMQANEVAGTIADRDQLVLFDPDGIGFAVYETQTGQFHRRGRLEPVGIEVRRPTLRSGMRLFYFAELDGQWHYRVRDLAGHDRLLLSAAAPSRSHFDAIDQSAIAYVAFNDDLVLFDLDAGEETLRTDVAVDWAKTASIRVARTSDQLLLTTQPAAASPSSHYRLTTSDIRLPSVPLDGELIAIDAASGRVDWRALVGKSTLIDTFATESPVLLVANRVRDLTVPGQNRIVLDVRSRATGAVLASATHLPRTPLLRWDYDAEADVVTLDGEEAGVRITLSTTPEHHASARP